MLESLKSDHPIKQRRQRILKINLITRRVFSEKDIWRIVHLRYGSFDDYSKVEHTYTEVGKMIGVKMQTVRAVILRFEKDGFNVVMRRKTNTGR